MIPSQLSNNLPVDRLSDLLNRLEEHANGQLMVFRGQACDWPLLPKIARQQQGITAEQLSTERSILNSFKQRLMKNSSNWPTNDWDWLTLLQHDRLPTRLLDWTGNPLAALWFAIQNEKPDAQDAVLWAYQPSKRDTIEHNSRNPLQLNRTRFFQPTRLTRRLAAQDGYFTVHASDSGLFIPLEDDEQRVGTLTKFVVPKTSFTRLRSSLEMCGIGRSSLFPDLGGVPSYLV